MALRSRLITDPNEVLWIIEDMSDGYICSGENNSASDDDVISHMSEHALSDSQATVCDNDHIEIVWIFILVNDVCPKCLIMYWLRS